MKENDQSNQPAFPRSERNTKHFKNNNSPAHCNDDLAWDEADEI